MYTLLSAFVFDITQIYSRSTAFKNNLIELTASHMIWSFSLSSDKINSTLCKICQTCHWEVTTKKNKNKKKKRKKKAEILLNKFQWSKIIIAYFSFASSVDV